LFKTAIIGLGQIGYKLDEDPIRKLIWSHAKGYQTHNKTTLVAVSDINKANYENFNNNYPNIKFYDNYVNMVKEEDIDIISICAPTTNHLSIVKSLTNKNPPKAIFIEKPMGKSLSDAKEIVKLCKQNSIVLAVNYMRRWDVLYKYISDYLKMKSLGEIQTIIAYGTTALMTSTSHLIDLMVFLGGEVEWLLGALQNDYVRYKGKIPDPGGIALIKFNNNCFGFLKGTSKNQKNFMFEIDIVLSDGRVTIKEPWISNDFAEVKCWKFSARKNDELVDFYTLNEYKIPNKVPQGERMIDAISDIIYCIENDNPTQSNGSNAIAVHQIIQAVRDSSNNNKIVKFNG